MKKRLKRLLPGENFRMIVIAATIGLVSGGANILFRAVVEAVHEFVFVQGQELLHIHEGGWYRLLLPLLPITGMVLLIPFSRRYPGEVNGYSFPKFLRQVNLESGIVKFRTIILKIISSHPIRYYRPLSTRLYSSTNWTNN